MTEKIIILDFGSQYTQLIARRLRELNVFCEIMPYNKFPKEDKTIKAVILSGSPLSVLDEQSLEFDLHEIVGHYPVLGICYGAQYIAHKPGWSSVFKSDNREYGKAKLNLLGNDAILFEGIEETTQVWMSHADTISAIPDTFEIIAQNRRYSCCCLSIKGRCI